MFFYRPLNPATRPLTEADLIMAPEQILLTGTTDGNPAVDSAVASPEQPPKTILLAQLEQLELAVEEENQRPKENLIDDAAQHRVDPVDLLTTPEDSVTGRIEELVKEVAQLKDLLGKKVGQAIEDSTSEATGHPDHDPHHQQEVATTPESQPFKLPACHLPPAMQLGCAFCTAIKSHDGTPLKVCSTCRFSAPQMVYCSLICQKNDWPRHRRICGITIDRSTNRPVQLMVARITSTEYEIPGGPVERSYEILRRHENETLVYKLVVDAYRCLDEVKRGYNPQFFPLVTYHCWVEGYSFQGLRWFLDRTLVPEIQELVMPDWWDKKHRDEYGLPGRS
jgi:hypothetical protein